VGLQVNDGHGHSSTATQQIQAGNSPPVLGTVTPDDTLTWVAGDTINFSAAATDPQQGPMPASAFTWNVTIRHCPNDVCHTHNLQTYSGVSSGSFQAPPHEYPSHLLLTVTVTDSGGLTDTKTIQLNPKIVSLSFASVPSGAMVTVGSTDRTTPYSETFIQGAPVTITAAPTTGTGATVAAFSGWSDGGARSHTVTPPSAAATYTATYTRPTASMTANPTSGPAPLSVTYTASAVNAPGVSGSFTYAWDLDNDGQYDDGTGSTQSRTHNAPGSPVVKVLATDSRGATDSKSATVTVNNRPPIAAVTATPSSGTAPLSPTFSASGSSDPDGTALTYAWDLDDDGAFDDATGVTATRSFSGVGPHKVTVQVKDADNGTATASTTVTVTNRVPVAAVTANPTSGNSPLVPAFSASGSTDPDGTALTYAWDLDDDGAFDDATGVTATRSYSGVGPHKVTVQVKDANNGTATASVTVTVTNSGPTARITSTPSPATGNAPFAVTFSGSTSSDPDGGTLTYAWDLDGDGAYDDGTQAAAGRTYGVGNVTVGLKVTDIDGASSTASLPVTVPNRLPVAVVSANPTSGTAPLTVALSASGSSDPDGTALTYVWDTDDDAQFDDATGPTTSATFGGVGPHVVTVRVTDANSGSATKSVTVTVTNTGPAAHITTNPASGSGPAPLTVAFSGSTSNDPDGGPLTYAWDLDGDGQYDDGTGPTAMSTYPVGTVTVGLRVTDQQATSATTTASVDATNTAPTVTRVSTYPEGTWYVGQTLGFDAAATDPQQDLPDSAYSFVMERQDCDSGCPRVVVQRWTGVSTDRFVVPAMPYPSHLYLTASVTDDHGATGARTVRIEPRRGSLTVQVRSARLAVSVDGVDRKGGWSGAVVVGSTVRVMAPRHQFKKGVRYVFVKWTDGGARKHDIVVWETPVTVKAVYRRVN
jgi:PKD repeat protein